MSLIKQGVNMVIAMFSARSLALVSRRSAP